MPCPPLVIDSALERLIEQYRKAKHAASRAVGARAAVEVAGHYDKDASMPLPVVDSEAAQQERRAATALADALVAWVDRNAQ